MRNLRTAVWIALLLSAIAYLISSFHVVTDISEFLPNNTTQEHQVLREVATGKLARQMVLTVRVPADHDASAVSRRFEQALRSDAVWMKHIAHLEGGTDPDGIEALWTLYHSRWPYFFARSVEDAQHKLSDQGLEDAAQHLRQQLQGPMSMLVARMAPSDPFLVTQSVFERVENAQAGTISEQDGRWVTHDRQYAVLFLSTHASAFENKVQHEVLRGICDAFDRVNAQYDTKLSLEMSGVNRISIAAQQTIERDIQRISIVSAILLFGLLWWIFGGIRVTVLAMMSIGTGVLMALSVSHLVFGRVHGIALAFGASLIGLAIDYVLHLYSHYAEAKGEQSAHAIMRQILPALLIAASSTLIGFVALGFTGFPGLREVAVFAVVGLGSALATVAWVVVDWIPQDIPQMGAREILASQLMRGFEWLRSSKWPAIVLLMCMGGVIVLGVPHIRWSGQWGESSQFDTALVQEEERVRARVSQFDQSRLIVSTGATIEDALQSAERVADLLEEKPWVGGFASITYLLPSQQRQEQVAKVVQNPSSQHQERFERIFEAAGFRAQMFQPFFDTLDASLPPPLNAAALEQSPMRSVLHAFMDQTENGVVILTPVRDVKDTAQLRERLQEVTHATFIDERDLLADAQGTQRGRILVALSVGLLAVCALLYWRYRKLRLVCSALVPSIVSVLFTWSVLALCGIGLDLIVVAFSLLIISLGVDYGVFLIDTLHERGPDLRAALVGIVMAGTTTLIGFGLLAASDFPILHRVGLVALVGVCSAMVLSPIALVLAGQEKGS